MDTHQDARRLNTELGLVGLRAQATAIGLVQLCRELRSGGVLSDEGLTRIKAAIADQVVVSFKPHRGRHAFEAAVRQRLDKLFPTGGEEARHDAEIGPIPDLGSIP